MERNFDFFLCFCFFLFFSCFSTPISVSLKYHERERCVVRWPSERNRRWLTQERSGKLVQWSDDEDGREYTSLVFFSLIQSSVTFCEAGKRVTSIYTLYMRLVSVDDAWKTQSPTLMRLKWNAEQVEVGAVTWNLHLVVMDSTLLSLLFAVYLISSTMMLLSVYVLLSVAVARIYELRY